LEPVRSRIGDRLLGLAVQTPIGAAIDETRAKRGAIVLALAVLGIGATIIFAWSSFWPVAIANCVMAIVGDVFGPAVAALTLGLYARKQLARRMGTRPLTMQAMSPSP
jgi:predicted MFS family arabinose efflux permease